jgi:molecular chaperone GrpE
MKDKETQGHEEKPKSAETPTEANAPANKQQEEIETLKKEKDELFGKLQRLSADYANFQKRVPKQVADSVTYEKERVIKSLLPTFDNFEHTLKSISKTDNIEAVVKGIKIVHDQMLATLKSHGVEVITACGEDFDPASHEVLMHRAEPDKENNIILEEYQKGYKLNGRVIRPSKVVINKIASQPAEPQPDDKKPETKTGEDAETTDTE